MLGEMSALNGSGLLKLALKGSECLYMRPIYE